MLAVALLLPLTGQTGDEREGTGGVIFGPGFAFAIGAPDGWIFDTKSALLIGSRAVIYPAGYDLESTNVMIHANAFGLGDITLDLWIKQDIQSLKQDFVGIEVNDLDNLITQDSITAIVKEFDPGQSTYGLYERIAYIDLETSVAVVSLSAQNKDAYQSSIAAFDEVVVNFSNFKKQLNLQPADQ